LLIKIQITELLRFSVLYERSRLPFCLKGIRDDSDTADSLSGKTIETEKGLTGNLSDLVISIARPRREVEQKLGITQQQG